MNQSILVETARSTCRCVRHIIAREVRCHAASTTHCHTSSSTQTYFQVRFHWLTQLINNLSAQKEHNIIRQSSKRKESNRRAHSKPGTVPYVPERQKKVVREEEWFGEKTLVQYTYRMSCAILCFVTICSSYTIWFLVLWEHNCYLTKYSCLNAWSVLVCCMWILLVLLFLRFYLIPLPFSLLYFHFCI